MNLVQLQTFLTIARLGSFRRAAEQLNATQPAISARIAGLEESLGAALFFRDAGKTRLTAKGAELAPLAERLIALSEEIRLKIGDASTISGVLRLGVSETIVQTWLPRFLQRVRQEYPNLDFDITVDITANMRDALVAHALDLAFLMGPVSEYSVSNLDLRAYPLIWVASPSLPIEDRLYRAAELAHWPILTFARTTRPHESITAYFRDVPAAAPRIFGSTSLSACKQMAIDGLGIAAIPEEYARREIREKSLRPIQADWTPPDLLFTASYANAPNNRLAAIIARTGQIIAQEPEPD